jgi:hypothetical protein
MHERGNLLPSLLTLCRSTLAIAPAGPKTGIHFSNRNDLRIRCSVAGVYL